MEWFTPIGALPYLVLFLYIYRNLLKTRTYHPPKNPGIFVSVIIPCRNEENNIEELLGCIARQDYPSGNFEVIVVDDHSEDDTYKKASSFKLLRNLQVIPGEGTGKKNAIRSGISISRGNLIVTTDGDCRMGSDWLTAIASYYSDLMPDLIVCPVKLQQTTGFFGKFQELEFLALQGVTAGSLLAGHPSMCNGANLSFTREIYEKHTGKLRFNIPSGDDIFLLQSVKKDKTGNIKWLESPHAIVETSSSPGIIQFIRQRARWISKAGAYHDRFTILLAVVTLLTIILELLLYAAIFARTEYMAVLGIVIFIKSVPDFLIIRNTARRYSLSHLMKWFLPAQIIYPVYVIAVIIYSLIVPYSGSFSYPSPKGI